MTYSHFSGDEPGVPEFQSPPKTKSKSLVYFTNVTGAVVSLGLIAGIGVWSYKLVMRDVTGIPVVRAAAGEMRVRPEDPGGMQAQHQGLAVNAVAADGEAEAPADRIVLAPRPVALAEEDQPITPETVASVQQPESVAEPAPEPETAEAKNFAAAVTFGNVDDMVSELTKDVEPMDVMPVDGAGVATELAALDDGEDATAEVDVVTEIEGEPVALAEIASEDSPDSGTEAAIMAALMGIQEEEKQLTPEVSRSVPGVRNSIRPRQRPDGGPEMLIQASLSVPETSAVAEEIDARKIPQGTRLAQLGAYESPEVARAEWERLETRFGDYLDGKSRVIEKASTGGRTFYRLRAMGFIDLADARRFCSALVAESADCIPVVTR